jgi:hypothetical protein
VRGSPILRSAVVLLALLALAPMLWRLTEPATAGAPTSSVPVRVTKTAAIDVDLNFSSPANRVIFQHLGAEIWSKSQPALDESFSCKIPWPKEGVELRVLVEWPEGAPSAAMRLRTVSPTGTEYDRTVWGSGTVEEVLVLP